MHKQNVQVTYDSPSFITMHSQFDDLLQLIITENVQLSDI